MDAEKLVDTRMVRSSPPARARFHLARLATTQDRKCRLCDQIGCLVDGHVFPSFPIKRFVVEPGNKHGGRFLDLERQGLTNFHLKRRWFCAPCDNERLGGLERYAANLCDQLVGAPNSSHQFDGRFARFAASVCWRVALLNMPEARQQWARDALKRPCRRWKEFVRGDRSDPRPYSLHAFVVFSQSWRLERGLGGEVSSDGMFVFSQLGPLFIVGLLDRSHLTLQQIELWERSELRPTGGSIVPLTIIRENEVPQAFFKQFVRHEDRLQRKLRSFSQLPKRASREGR